jgi:hypothetical protein
VLQNRAFQQVTPGENDPLECRPQAYMRYQQVPQQLSMPGMPSGQLISQLSLTPSLSQVLCQTRSSSRYQQAHPARPVSATKASGVRSTKFSSVSIFPMYCVEITRHQGQLLLDVQCLPVLPVPFFVKLYGETDLGTSVLHWTNTSLQHSHDSWI